MSMGSPTFRVRTGSDTLTPGSWGVQPAGPLLAIGGHTPVMGRISTGLPSKETVDYVHSLTQTSLLLIGLAVFLVLYRDRPVAAARRLVGRVG
jgi:hypothetical protein